MNAITRNFILAWYEYNNGNNKGYCFHLWHAQYILRAGQEYSQSAEALYPIERN